MTRVCIETGCPILTEGTRCPAHQQELDRARNAQPARQPRRTRAYRANPSTGVCHICGKPGADSRDHVIPLAAGGSNTPDNIRPAHLACNSKKGYRVALDPDAMRRETR